MSHEVWYVSYGSNMSRARLGCYLAGGRPPGAARTYAGARDASLPRAELAVELPGRLYFAGRSTVWGGGVAFYDHDVPGPTPARAYRISVEQFADIAAQEMHRVPADGDPLEEVVIAGLTAGRHEAGPGHYETLIEVGRHDGLPMLTFTAPHGHDAVPHTRPSPAYLAMLADGLRCARAWDDQQIDDYFADVVPDVIERAQPSRTTTAEAIPASWDSERCTEVAPSASALASTVPRSTK